jgi:hypothetical protein
MTVPAAEWFATDIDLRHNQLISARAENRGTAPANPAKGQLWFDTSSAPQVLKYWDGTAWISSRSYYDTVADDGVARAQRGTLDFRSSESVAATVTDDGSHDTSAVSLDAKFGPVAESVVAGAPAANGTAATVARSDHTHGTPSSGGADVALTSWWQYSRELWEQQAAPSTFIAELPGQTVGGGWQIGTGGSVYWNGDPIPVSEINLYRNNARVSALGSSAALSMGWLCYDADHELLGPVMCSNQVAVVPAKETGILVAQNLVTKPGAEDASPTAGEGPEWHSNPTFGSGAVGTVEYSTARYYSGSQAVKVTWPSLGSGTTHSNCVIDTQAISPGSLLTLSAEVYVPAGNPDVKLHYVFAAESPTITAKDQWVHSEVELTVPDDGQTHHYFVGLDCAAPAAGKVAYLDNVLLRIGGDPLPNGRTYFDGDTVSLEDETFVWDGEPQNSTSSYYTVEPSWENVAGFIANGDGPEPATGATAAVEAAVAPLPGTVFFRPFITCTAGQLIIDTHEVIRSPRELRMADGLETGWVASDGTITAPDISTGDISPPDTDPVVPMRIGPVVDPPEQAGDVTSRSYVDRALGLLPDQTGVPPQFQWAGDPGVSPQPADLGFLFAAWPLFSLWFDTNVQQARPTYITGTYQGATSNAGTLTGAFTQIPGSYAIVFTPPVDGAMIAFCQGSVYAEYADYAEIRCGMYADVDASGNDGTLVGAAGSTVYSASSGATVARQGYLVINAARVVGGTTYKVCTDYSHGGPSVVFTRDRSHLLYLPNVAVKP